MTPGTAKRIVSCLLPVLLLSGTSSAGWIEDREDGTTVVHVKVWQLPDPSDSRPHARADVAAVKRFKERFPEIFAERWRAKYEAAPERYGHHNWDHVEVELHKATGIRVQGVESDLLAIAGGLAPDIMYINFRKSDTYIRNNFLYPLDEYIADMPKDEFDFRVHPKIVPVIHRKGPDGEKRTWAFPFGGALGRVLWYRRDLFDRHGIPYPDKAWTWEDMFDACKRITDPSRGVYGCRLGRGGWFWLTWLWSAGGDVMAYNETSDEWRCVFGSRQAAVALEYYSRIGTEKWADADGKIQRGYTTLEVSESAYTKWERGEIGMMVAYIDERMFGSLNPETTGMAPVPLGPPDPQTGARMRGGELNSRMMGMFAEIKEPAVRDAAWEYMRFYDGPEAMEIKTRIMVEGGMGRFMNPKYLRLYGYPEVERLAPPGWGETFEIAIASGKPEPYGKNSNLAYVMMGYPVDEVIRRGLKDDLPTDKTARIDVIEQILRDAEARANEEMIGLVTPHERLLRRVCAVVALAGIAAAFGLVFRKIIRAFTPKDTGTGELKGWQFARYKWAYALLVPALLTICMWRYVPLLRGSMMAFLDYRLLGTSTFAGVDNFGDLLFDGFWWRAVWNSLRYSFLVVTLTFLPPIILAIALQEVPRGKILYRVIYYLPAVITGLVTVLLWKQFYQPSERGALNAAVMSIPAIGFIGIGLFLLVICLAFVRRLRLHEMRVAAWCFGIAGVMLFVTCSALAGPILFPAGEAFAASLMRAPSRLFSFMPEPYRWLADSKTAMLSCVMPMVWAGMGPGCLIYLAALKGIPDDYYEAADMDGATFIDKILFVVFPTLKALIIINFVGVFIRSWYGATGNILVMTGGAANTETVGLHIWYKAFTFLKFGPATAAAWMLGFMLIGFTVHQLRVLSRVEFRAQGTEK